MEEFMEETDWKATFIDTFMAKASGLLWRKYGDEMVWRGDSGGRPVSFTLTRSPVLPSGVEVKLVIEKRDPNITREVVFPEDRQERAWEIVFSKAQENTDEGFFSDLIDLLQDI